MKKTYNVDEASNNMRLDRWIRSNIGNLPQGFIEKNLRNGKIKLNNKKIKSSHKIKKIGSTIAPAEVGKIAGEELLKLAGSEFKKK